MHELLGVLVALSVGCLGQQDAHVGDGTSPEDAGGANNGGDGISGCAMPNASSELWVSVGLSTETVRAFAFDASGYLFATINTPTGGIWRASAPCYSDWEKVRDGNYFAIAVSTAGTVFAATTTIAPAEIWRSTDSGMHWQLAIGGFATADLGNGDIGSLVASPTGDVLAGMSWAAHNIYRTSDQAASWTASVGGQSPPPSDDVRALFVASPAVLYAGSESHGLYRSSDDGHAWTLLGPTPAGHAINVVRATKSGQIFTGNHGMSRGVTRSLDNGQSWSYANPPSGFGATNPISWAGPVEAMAISGDGTLYIGAIQTQPALAATIQRSTDFGTTWSPYDAGLDPTAVTRALAFGPDGFLYRGGIGGVMRSAAALD